VVTDSTQWLTPLVDSMDLHVANETFKNDDNDGDID